MKPYILVVVCVGTMDSNPPPPSRYEHKGKKSKSINDITPVPVSENKSTAYNALSEYDQILMFVMDDL